MAPPLGAPPYPANASDGVADHVALVAVSGRVEQLEDLVRRLGRHVLPTLGGQGGRCLQAAAVLWRLLLLLLLRHARWQHRWIHWGGVLRSDERVAGGVAGRRRGGVCNGEVSKRVGD